jgi:Gas vesicle synthesis protein GvpL/GvpF
MSVTSYYVYGIVRYQRDLAIASPGVGNGSPVALMVHGDLAAIVSTASAEDADGNRRTMLAHTRVLEEVMRAQTVLPLSFGTIAPDLETIRHSLLGERAHELHTLLGQLDGRIELGLKAIWYEEPVFRAIVEQHADIRALRDQLAGKSLEEGYYDRIRLGELTEKALQAQRASDSARILAALQPLAEQTRTLDIFADRMVVNAAFLVQREHETTFEAAIHELDATMAGRMLFKVVGPVPPYNFVQLALHWETQQSVNG